MERHNTQGGLQRRRTFLHVWRTRQALIVPVRTVSLHHPDTGYTPPSTIVAVAVRLEGGGDLWQPGSNDTAKANMNKYGQR